MKKNICLILLLALIVTGCYWKNNGDGTYTLTGKFDGAAEKGVAYLEKKYNTDCEFVKYDLINDDWYGIHRFYVRCDKLINKDIYIVTNLVTTKKGEFTFLDNYYLLKYEDEIRITLNSSVKSNMPKAVLAYDAHLNQNSSKENIENFQNVQSLNQFLSNSKVYYTIFVKASDYTGRKDMTAKINQLLKSLTDHMINSVIGFEVIADKDFASYDGYDNSVDSLDFAKVLFNEELNCYTIYWYCSNCTEGRTKETCID
jgi:hypothetical protein